MVAERMVTGRMAHGRGLPSTRRARAGCGWLWSRCCRRRPARSRQQSRVPFWLAFPSVAAAFGLLLGFDVVAVRACGSKVARIFGVSAFADGHDLVDSG